MAINGQGFVVTEGLLAGLDTTGATAAGDPVWLGTDGNLIYGLANKPVAPAHLVFIGVVTRRNANNGEIFVKVQNGFEFNELHDLSVASPSDGDMIKYVASTGLWTKIAATTTNIAEGTNLYYTNTRSRTAISLTTSGTSGAATYDNATGVINIPQYQGGVTSFNTRTGAITLSSSDVTTALTYTPVTNARTLTINGTTYDLTADRSWSIAAGVTSFNTRTGAISLTSLDVTDALTYTPVTNARTLTINGTSYDLSANRSWTIAPDTSVRNIYGFTATANQTTFTVSGGYTVGLVDVFINGVKLAAADFTATNGTTVVLGTGTGVGNIVEIIKYVSAFTTAVENSRTLTINGTTYDLSENRTWSITNASLGAQPQLNGTGLVRMSGTTVSYDNATYATQSYVTTAVANLVDAAPSTLDTLNELAAALGDDPNFATTIATSIGTKLPSSSVSGTTNYLAKFTGTSAIGNSQIFDNGSNVGINQTTLFTKFSVADGLAATSVGSNYNPGIVNIQNTNTTNGNLSLIGFQDASAFINLAAIGSINEVHSSSPNNVRGSLGFYTKNNGISYVTEKMRLDPSGNLGLGVTPGAWTLGIIQQIGTTSALWNYINTTYLTNNRIFSSGNKYITNGFSTSYEQDSTGSHVWLNAPSGTAGAAMTMTPVMYLNASGNLSVGNTNDTYKLDVSGEGRFYQPATTSTAYLRVENNRSRNAALRLTTTVGDYYLGVGIGADVNQFQIYDGNAGANRLTIASTGAATFSSSINVTTTGTFGFQDYRTQATQKVLVLNAEGVSGNYAPSLFNIYTKPGTHSNGIGSIIIKGKYGTESESGNLFELKGDGSAIFSNIVSASSFSSVSTSASIPFTTWTTIYNTDAYLGGIYIVQVGLNGGSSDDWSASAIYFSGASTDMRYLVGPVNGNLVQLRKTGNSIQVYQNGTSPSITLTVRVLKVS